MKKLHTKQTGAALIIGLIFLVLLAVVGLSSMRSVTLQERTIGNSVDNYRAQHNADVALYTAEENVKSSASAARTLFLNTVNDGVSHAEATVWANCGDAAQNADQLCEELSAIADAKYETTDDDDTYIITVRAQGSANASVMLQSTFVGRIEEQR